MTAARRGNGIVGHPPKRAPVRSLPPDIEAQVERKHARAAARAQAVEVLKGEGPALGLSLLELAEVHDSLAAGYRQKHEDAKRAGRKQR